MEKGIQWSENTNSVLWDKNLALLGGHPLQTALWGDARQKVDGIANHRWEASLDGQVVWMARIEERHIPMVGRIAWIPKGSTTIAGYEVVSVIESEFVKRLKHCGYIMAVTDRWRALSETHDASGKPRTIWLDLSMGSEQLWTRLDKQWRYGVSRSRREGIVCEVTKDKKDIAEFFSLCKNISQAKGFELPGSLELITYLLQKDQSDGVSTHLFVARHNGVMGAGACVIRCGRSAHYFWGASDRSFARYRMGEAVQWAVISWAIEQGCNRYDLEGIDPVNNPGVYDFKKKMGGEEVTLEGIKYFPLRLRGSLIERVQRLVRL
jgi:lipid II:glycine glycyltransferase (peptidoglycan interpeptide bridge formation enzyme)